MAQHEWTQGYWQSFLIGATDSYQEAALRFPEWSHDQLERYLSGCEDGVASRRSGLLYGLAIPCREEPR
jgi:hypothetical protein